MTCARAIGHVLHMISLPTELIVRPLTWLALAKVLYSSKFACFLRSNSTLPVF